MKITGIDYHVLLIPEYDVEATSSAQDDLVVVVHTDEGIDGVGETDTNPWIARECIRARGTHSMGRGLEELLIGADPMQPENLWRKLYSSTKMTGRRGIMICALGAIDMALWDIRGKALVEKIIQAKSQGYTAAKLEICINGPYAHHGLQERDEAVVTIVAACREAVGPDMVLMVDVAYAWSDTKAALRTINCLQSYDVFFIETPLDMDDLDGYAYLVDHSPIRIAAGEWQNTHFEFLDLINRGKVDVLQPDIGRVGGFSEARLVCQIAAARGKLIVPHCWKSGIGIAASAHLCVATACCPYIEFLPSELSESPLRRELVTDELRMVHGSLSLPEEPGLGVVLNRSALQKYEVV